MKSKEELRDILRKAYQDALIHDATVDGAWMAALEALCTALPDVHALHKEPLVVTDNMVRLEQQAYDFCDVHPLMNRTVRIKAALKAERG